MTSNIQHEKESKPKYLELGYNDNYGNILNLSDYLFFYLFYFILYILLTHTLHVYQEHKLYVEVAAALCEERIVWREDGVPLIQSKENPNQYT